MTIVIPHRFAVYFVPAALLLVLGLYSTIGSAQQQQLPGQPPFANAVEQRAEMIRELREIKDLLKEQNAWLRANLKSDHGPKPR